MIADEIVDGIEKLNDVHHKPASQENLPEKTRRKSVVNREAVRKVVKVNVLKVVKDVMALLRITVRRRPHHDVTEKTNEKKRKEIRINQKTVAERKIKVEVAVGPRSHRAN